jgi:hypothetical protein
MYLSIAVFVEGYHHTLIGLLWNVVPQLLF